MSDRGQFNIMQLNNGTEEGGVQFNNVLIDGLQFSLIPKVGMGRDALQFNNVQVDKRRLQFSDMQAES